MKQTFFLFDMDGVLLFPKGYHQSLRESVNRIGTALGAPQTNLTDNQVARFEALSVTNEWDSLAICTALILLHVWQVDGSIRFKGITESAPRVSNESPDFDLFLANFTNIGDLPGLSAYQTIVNLNPLLDTGQVNHLEEILLHCRDIYNSLTLPIHQETVLGSQTFKENYSLDPQLDIESFLLHHDRPVMTEHRRKAFFGWLNSSENHAGIMTNRPSRTPPGYLSSPEAELGAALIGLEDLPLLGSGLLAWYAVTRQKLPDHTFLKPNPIHALALLQMLLGVPSEKSLDLAHSLWVGQGDMADWVAFEGSTIIIFEDAVKGLDSGITAQKLLQKIGVSIDLNLVGVTENPIKKKALTGIADVIIDNINQITWDTISDAVN